MEKIAGLVVGAVVLLLIVGYLFVNMWPVVVLIVAVVIVVAVIMWAVRKLKA